MLKTIIKSIEYKYSNNDKTLNLTGVAYINNQKEIINFTGSFTDLNNQYYGDFAYSEKDTINMALSNVPDNFILDITYFLLEAINSFKKESFQ